MKLLDDVLEAHGCEAMSTGRNAEAVEHGNICPIRILKDLPCPTCPGVDATRQL
jgi:hypothetical protein